MQYLSSGLGIKPRCFKTLENTERGTLLGSTDVADQIQKEYYFEGMSRHEKYSRTATELHNFRTCHVITPTSRSPTAALRGTLSV